MIRTLLGLLLVAVVAGCAGRAPGPGVDDPDRAAYAQRAEFLSGLERWSLAGRLGVDAGDDGGSGRLDWQVDGPASSMHFRGTLGRGAWRLEAGREGAVLYRADGTEERAASLGELVAREAGLPIPVEALHWWVRGLAQPEQPHELELDGAGLPVALRQADWLIRFETYIEHAGHMLPRKLEATRGDYAVRLAVSRWTLGDDDGA